jgi:hypothetical protein
MAKTSLEAVTICTNTQFTARIKILLTKVATEVLAEDPDTPFHNVRARWASRFSSRSAIDVEKACNIVSFSPAVEDDSEDDVLLPILRQHLNVLAGAFNPAPEPVDGVPQEVIVEFTDHDNDPNTAPIRKRTIRNLFGLLR